MGTPQFAVAPLEALIQGSAPGTVLTQGYEIATVITRTDKPVGRGQEIIFSPVKRAALAHGLPVWQPGSLKRSENIEALAALHADLSIVAAFGQILPQAVLDQPRYGTLNVHASLLPKYRGVSPIAEAILQGDAETGVTIMLLDAGVDTGPALLKKSTAISKGETTGSLTGKLSELGAQALLEALPGWIEGRLKAQPQEEELASHTKMLRKEDGEINWLLPAAVLARKVRAYTPWPGTYTHWRGKRIKIVAAAALARETDPATSPGTVAVSEEAGHTTLAIVTGAGFLLVRQVQLEGKRVMSVEEFLRGYPQIVREVLR
jgi:methionyl-tRNA formyltransferase